MLLHLLSKNPIQQSQFQLFRQKMQQKFLKKVRRLRKINILMHQSKTLKMIPRIWKLNKTLLSLLKNKRKISRLLNLRRNKLLRPKKTHLMHLPRILLHLFVNNKRNGPKLRKKLRKRNWKKNLRVNRRNKRSSRKKKSLRRNKPKKKRNRSLKKNSSSKKS